MRGSAALYRLQRDEPGLDLLAMVHRASAHASKTDLSQLHRLLPAPMPMLSSAQEQDFAAPVQGVGSVADKACYCWGPHELQAQPKMRVFRAKTALTVEWGSLSRTPVLFFQAARRLNSQDDFDWSRRINIAVSAQESFDLLQVCLGRTDHCKLQFHGTHRNKSVELKKSADAASGFSLLVRLSQPGSSAVLGLAGFDVASLVQLLAISIASKLPVAGNAANVSFLAQTVAMLELKRSP